MQWRHACWKVTRTSAATSQRRNVLATSLTTIAGFTPLVLAGGGFWPPLAIAIAGGVGGATLLALTFVPGTYRWLRLRIVSRSL